MLLEGHGIGYARLGLEWYVAEDQGENVRMNGLDSSSSMTLQQCENACTHIDGCNSFAHCPRDENRCWLMDKVFKGNEPTTANSTCSTYYKKGIRAILLKNLYIFSMILQLISFTSFSFHSDTNTLTSTVCSNDGECNGNGKIL